MSIPAQRSDAAYSFDPELAKAAHLYPARDLTDLAAARQGRALPSVGVPAEVSVADHHFDVEGRADQLLVRVYRPTTATNVPCVLTLHAGGFVFGSIEQDHRRNVALSHELGAVVLAIEYRLAPEHPYPAALQDCYAALRWIRDNAAQFAVDAGRIAVYGRSAGGGLAAGTALLARDSNGPAICFLYLGMPQLDDRLTSESARRFVDTPVWTRQSAEVSWAMYLGEGVPGTDQVAAYAAPARATDLRGLPPTYISAMEFDPLRDDAMAFGQALVEAGVPTELHLFPGTFHGSSALVDAEISRVEQAEELRVLRRGLARVWPTSQRR